MSPLAPKKRYNLRDVAHHAGVSVATVSRVLNAPTRVSSETRDRVNSAITELRFVPSAAARAINSGRTKMVAALLPTLDNSIYARAVNGLENRLAEAGLSLVVAQTSDDPTLEVQRARQMIDIGAEGLIVAGVSHAREFHDLVAHVRVPMLAISFFDETADMPTVGYDNWDAAQCAARHLVDLGHRDIAVIHGPLAGNDRTQRRRAALDAFASSASFTYIETDLSVAGGAAAAVRMMASAASATAALCFSDVLARGAMAALQSRGIEVPKVVSVMGMEDLPSSAFTYPSLTSVALSVEQMGERAAAALAAWLEKDQRPDHIQLDVELIQRASTGPARS